MNSKNIIGITLVTLAAVVAGCIVSSVGESAARYVGKAVWYVPYILLVGSVRFFAAR